MNTLDGWKDLYARAHAAYQPELEKMIDNEQAYMGTRPIKKPDGTTAEYSTTANVRRAVFEMIEAQVDSTIPMPKATALNPESQGLTQIIEEMLKNQMDRLPIEEINDVQERICPVDGAAFLLVEWDNDAGVHKAQGDIAIRAVHPRQVIPQPGATSLDESDYVFVALSVTPDYIMRNFGIKVDDTQSEAVEMGSADGGGVTDNVEWVKCFYRDEEGHIGLMSWVAETVVEDFPNYFSRHKDVCKACGADIPGDSDSCPICKRKEFKSVKSESTILAFDISDNAGEVVIPAGTKIPNYEPTMFPLIMRKNISQYGSFVGGSDAEAVKDQQNDINIFSNKLRDKLLKGGSIVMKHPEMQMEATDEELKIVEATPDQAASFRVQSVQPDVQNDLAILNQNYEWMRSTLGITDSFQGKRDTTALSGKAKQMMIERSAGRLESKRQMKNAMFARLYHVMFQYMLAFSDEPRSYMVHDASGNVVYEQFNKYDFLRKDESGEWYWDDEFMFAIDASATLSRDRSMMWQEARNNFQSGCFGPATDLFAVRMFWESMAAQNYPTAKHMLDMIRQREAELQAQQQMAVQQQTMLGMPPVQQGGGTT